MDTVNIMEQLVRERLEVLLPNVDCCKCDMCKSDMLAIALNSLVPKYVNTHAGELLVKINQTSPQNAVDIDCAITKAINIVSANPRHNK